MNASLTLVLALCVGQVPPGTTSTYAPVGNNGTGATTTWVAVEQSQVIVPSSPSTVVYPTAMPEQRGTIRGWFQRHFGSRPSQPSCNCAKSGWNNQMVPQATTGYVIAPGAAMPAQAASTTSEPPAQGVPVTVDNPNRTANEIISIPAPQPGEPPQADALNAPPPANLANSVESSPLPGAKLNEKYENKVGHDPSYSWVTGHLFFVHADGGKWVVRYALPGEVDKFGGSIVLAPGVEMKNFREGDLVCVYGEVLNEQRTSPQLGGALYRVNSILMVERGE